MTTSEYDQLQENLKLAKLMNEVQKIYNDISEITWILTTIPFDIETVRQKIYNKIHFGKRHIIGNLNCTFLNIIFQKETPQNTFLHCMKCCEGL